MTERNESFARAAKHRQRSLFAELISFVIHNKKWWLTPIVVLLIVASLLVLLGGSAAAPFIYSLF